ncbi:MAG TPA: M28 family peptidase [Bryobacteraceae bacterium]|nr:M28 family peptidase [Bryobacteraceae bacterium]
MFRILFILAFALGISAQPDVISGEKIRAHVKFLASDLLEGRGVGTRGGDLATDYIATQFALTGAKPAGDSGTYFQRVPLVGVTTQPTATLSVEAQGKSLQFRWLDDFVGSNELQTPNERIDADAIFVGHGIVAPEFHWDDYKGVDVKGKVVVLFTNEPPSDNPKFFGGKALTYYGRWTYKYEEAARHGARAVLILHTTPTAGYGWNTVKGSWSKEDPQVPHQASQPALAFAGWVSQESAEKLAALIGKNLDQLLEAANKPDFHPIPLNAQVHANIPSDVRRIESRNVAAVVEGSDPELKSQYVVFSAHWDHLGIGPEVNGDKIYNGAVDNATGCGILVELARAWASLEHKPRRSALFLAVTAEEAGLRGSEYYAQHPEVPLDHTALDLNFDAFYPFGRTKDISVTGAEKTAVWPTVQQVAKRMELEIQPDSHPEQGHYYRSDHFSFAHAGVPAFSISLGTQFYGKPADYGEKIFEEFNTKHYHQPSDEYNENWDFAGMVEAADFGLRVGLDVANQPKLPSRMSPGL